METSSKCDNCGEDDFHYYCDECKEHLCIDCNNRNHQKGKKTFHIRSEVYSRQLPIKITDACREHPLEQLFWFCNTCDHSVCNKCCDKDGSHRGHDFVLCSSKANTLIRSLRELMAEATIDLEQAYSALIMLENLLFEIGAENALVLEKPNASDGNLKKHVTTKKSAIAKIDDHFAGIMKLVHIEHQKALNVVEDFVTMKANGWSTRAECLRKNIVDMERCDQSVLALQGKSSIEQCTEYSEIVSKVRNIRSEWANCNISDDSSISVTVNASDVLGALESSWGVGTAQAASVVHEGEGGAGGDTSQSYGDSDGEDAGRSEGGATSKIDKSDQELLELYNQAFRLGNENAAEMLKQSAADGHHLAVVLVGQAFTAGSAHFPRNREVGLQMISRELEWLKEQASGGNVVARARLGLCYSLGTGVAKNAVEGVRLFRLAALEGCADAQTNLGVSCYEGIGLAKNQEEAVRWYRLAADQGHANAQYSLGFCYEHGTGVPKSHQEAVRWYRLAADQGLDKAIASV